MDTCPIAAWGARVRDALLIAAAGLTVSMASGLAIAEPPVPPLLRRLVDPRFEIRTEAERELTRLQAVDLPPLEKAAQQNSEQAARVVAILERLYIGQSASNTEGHLARAALLSSLDPMLSIRRVGDFGETETTQAAEQALSRLAESETPAAPLARAALARHAVLAENRAIATLRKLGAKIVFSADRDPMHDALHQLAEGASPSSSPAEGLLPPAPLAVEHVYILRNWKGGVAGLDYLRRLRVDAGLQLYLVDGCGIKLEDTLPLKATIPGLAPIERSAATLGVKWVGYQISEDTGCEIAGITEGMAADKAGLRTNFIIKAVNGDPIRTFDDGTPRSLVHRLRVCTPGETVTLRIQRTANGAEEDIPVTLSDWSEMPDVQIVGYR